MLDNLTVVIPFRNGHATIDRLLASLPDGLPIIIVDDASEIPFRTGPHDQRPITVRRMPERGYFAGAVNAGIAACTTDVLILNQDVMLSGPALFTDLATWRGEYAVIGNGVMKHPTWPKGYIQGTCMFMRRDAINAVGLLNAEDFPLWGCTAEWQVRACRKGFRVLPVRRDRRCLVHT